MTTGTHPDPWAITAHDEAQAQSTHSNLTRPRRSHENQDDSPPEIDELAVVQVAHDGLRLRLRAAERDEAVRRMYGRVELDLIAWRLHTTTRTVHRVAARLGLTGHNNRSERITAPAP